MNSVKNFIKELLKKPFDYWILIIISGATLIFVVLYFEVKVGNWIKELKMPIEDTKKSYSELLNKFKQIDSEITIDKDKNYYYIKEKDFKNLQSLMIMMIEKNEKMRDRVSDDVTGIVDRVNLYTSIGIVLLTLIGIFIPTLVQHFASEELKGRQKKLEEEFGEKTGKITNLEDKYKEIDECKTKIDECKTKTDEHTKAVAKINENIKEIPPARLMFSLHCAMDINNIRYHINDPSKINEYLHNIFQNIYDDLLKCKECEIETEDKILKGSIYNFQTDCVAFRTCVGSGSRSILDAYGILIKALDDFAKEEISNNEKYDKIIESVKSIIEKIPVHV